VQVDVFHAIFEQQINFILFTEGFFQNHPELLQEFVTGDIDTRLKIYYQAIKEYKKSGFYDVTKLYSPTTLRIASQNVFESFEKKIENPNVDDFMSRHIKIIKVEKHET
jgi:uncharacterized iron-regulated protein